MSLKIWGKRSKWMTEQTTEVIKELKWRWTGHVARRAMPDETKD